MAIGQMIALATGVNPTKIHGSDKLIPRLSQMLDSWRKEDPPTQKKLPIEVDIPEYIAMQASHPSAMEAERTMGDLILIAFYYLLRVGEYTMKSSRNEMKRNKLSNSRWRTSPS